MKKFLVMNLKERPAVAQSKSKKLKIQMIQKKLPTRKNRRRTTSTKMHLVMKTQSMKRLFVKCSNRDKSHLNSPKQKKKLYPFHF